MFEDMSSVCGLSNVFVDLVTCLRTKSRVCGLSNVFAD